MTPSDRQSTRPTTASGMAGGDPVEDLHDQTVSHSSSMQNQEPMVAESHRGRQTHRAQDDGDGVVDSVSGTSQQSQRTDQASEFGSGQTHTMSQQQSSSQAPESRTTDHDPNHQSPRPASSTGPTIDDDDRNRRQGFLFGDLVVDVFLAHPRARLENTPVYRVIGLEAETFVYKLLVYRDPTGMAEKWISRNWAEIRLADENDRWEELE